MDDNTGPRIILTLLLVLVIAAPCIGGVLLLLANVPSPPPVDERDLALDECLRSGNAVVHGKYLNENQRDT